MAGITFSKQWDEVSYIKGMGNRRNHDGSAGKNRIKDIVQAAGLGNALILKGIHPDEDGDHITVLDQAKNLPAHIYIKKQPIKRNGADIIQVNFAYLRYQDGTTIKSEPKSRVGVKAKKASLQLSASAAGSLSSTSGALSSPTSPKKAFRKKMAELETRNQEASAQLTRIEKECTALSQELTRLTQLLQKLVADNS